MRRIMLANTIKAARRVLRSQRQSALRLPMLLLPLFFSAAAHAAEAKFSSTYTDFNLKACKEIEPAPTEGEGSATYECKGLKGLPVTFAEGDLRSLVAFGPDGRNHCAFHQTFSGFNAVGGRIEWRIHKGKPIATIFRWTVSYDPEDSSKTKSWLVVTKLDGANSCHMGYVEGAYPKANEKARWLADTAAEAFSCAKGIPVYFANVGTATDGIASSGGCEN